LTTSERDRVLLETSEFLTTVFFSMAE